MKRSDYVSGKGAQAYLQNQLQGLEQATPHRLIQVLLEAILEKLGNAKRAISQNDVAQKGEQLSWAISIIDHLRAMLNVEAGGEIAQNLYDLYTYAEQRLLTANVNADIAMIDEVAQIIIQIKTAWDVIPPEHHQGQ